MTIFVSIAAYRDPELIPTIEHCLRMARWPGDLRFGVCWQHGAGEPRPRPMGRQLRLLDVSWRDSEGACWARAECMKLYDREDWFLQLDSHHRFARGWDARLLAQAERTGSARPVVTGYVPAYDPAVPLDEAEPPPTAVRFDRFTPEGIALYRLGTMPDWEARRGAPMRGRFVSAHLLFAPGSFVGDVPYDPDLYFIGEELSLAIRAFTHGYDLFHPGEHIAWHEYTRKLRPKHWDDHVASKGVETAWHARDAVSLAKIRRFLEAPYAGRFGCGERRSFADYEAYAGLRFNRRYASRAARRGDEPSPPVRAKSRWQVRVSLDRSALAPAAFDQAPFWYLGFHDANGVELARDDVGRTEMGDGAGAIVIDRLVEAEGRPASWTVWPVDRQGRWLDKVERPIAPDCLALAR